MIAARVPVLVTLLVGFSMLAGSIRQPTSMPTRQPMREAQTVREVNTRIDRGDVSCHTRVVPNRPIPADASARCVDPTHGRVDPFAY